jgi:hypothetical protein
MFECAWLLLGAQTMRADQKYAAQSEEERDCREPTSEK